MFSLTNKIQTCTDEELMLLVCKADERAFTELYIRYSQKMLRFIHRLLRGDENKAQDMLQDLFMKIVQHPEKYDRNLAFSPWLYKIAANMCFNEIRNQKNRLRILETEFATGNDTINIKNEDYNLDAEIFKLEYERLFTKLDEEQQLLLTLRFGQELQVKEIAVILQIAEGTVKSRLFYLMKKFSRLLKEFNPVK